MNRKKSNLFLHLFLSVVIVLSSFYRGSLTAWADDHPDVVESGITYVYDPADGCNHGGINEENVESVNGTDITVPGGCVLHVEDVDASLNSLTIANGATVEVITGEETTSEKTLDIRESLNLSANSNLVIFGWGRVTVPTISAEESAFLILESIANKPSGDFALYDPSGEAEVPDVAWSRFIYTGTKWVDFIDPAYEFTISVDGYEEGIVTASYSIDGTNYVTLDSGNSASWTSGIDTYEIAFGIHDEGWDPYNGGTATIKVELTNTSKRMVLGGLGEFSAVDSQYAEPFNLSSQPQEYSFYFSNPSDLDAAPHDMHFALSYPDSGDGTIINTVNNYIYGYPANIENSLAKELYYRFIEVAMYGNFGISSVSDLEAKITASGDPYTISVLEADGSSDTRPAQNYTVAWGMDAATGESVSQTIPVYTLSNVSEYLVCTDFNESTGTGTTFYSRIAGSDEVNFSSTGDAACAITVSSLPNINNVQIGGNGTEKSVLNDDGIYSYSVCTFPSIQANLPEAEWHRYFSSTCRIMSTAKEYVVISGSGENKQYDGMGINGRNVDDVWTVGSGSQTQNAYVYIGETQVSLEALSGSGKTITGVTLTDASLADGVTIAGNTLTFGCNYYDTVPVNISFSDGSSKSIIINRIGLVIQYRYLEDDRDHDTTTASADAIYYDCKAGTCSFTKDYDSGEQILIYATYYHPTADNTTGNSNDLYLNLTFSNGSSRIIYHTDSAHNFSGYIAADGNSVATTSFIIGFAPAKNWDGNEWTSDITQQNYSEGAFYATVLNAGYDDEDSYGGTQTGSGRGVYWDGRITWYE